MESTPSDIVKEAAEEDSQASVETWGPEAFARRIRTKIHNFGAPLPPWEDKAARPLPQGKGIPKAINVILLGPTGSGKSSLIYTWWRALSGSVTGKEEFFAENVHNSFLERLRVGWNAEQEEQARRRIQASASAIATGESSTPANAGSPPTEDGDHVRAGEALMRAPPRHGTSGLDAFQLQAPNPFRGSAGITVHDTKGQQFFTEEEERFAEKMLEGKVEEGSAVDKQNFKYWFMVGKFGFFSTASLATAPHVVVLVFDVTIRSFQQMLRERQENELCMCYRKIVRRAAKQGHEVFAVLTHIDAYSPDDDDEDDEENTTDPDEDGGGEGEDTSGSLGEEKPAEERASTDGTGTGFDRGAMPGIISLWREALSQAMGDGKKSPLLPQNVFTVHNYHKGSAAQDPVRDLAALECLEGVIHAGKRYVDKRYQKQQEGCVIA